MEQEEQFFSESKQKVEAYIQDRILLFKLEFVEKISKLVAVLFSGLIIALLGFFILLFISIMAGYFFASLTNSLYTGFAIVAAFYLILLFVVLRYRKNIIEKNVINGVIKVLFDKEKNTNE